MSRAAGRLGPLDRLLAAVAVLLGGTSLALFAAFLFGIDLGIVRLPDSATIRLLADAGLCLLFFLQHSLMLRRSFRERLARIVAHRRHGALYAAASGVLLAALVLLWQPTHSALYAAEGPGRWILHGVQGSALASVLWGWRALGGFDPFGVTPLRRGEMGADPSLTIQGPYCWVRHPLYLAFLVATWTVPVLTTDRLLFNVLWSVWIVLGCVLEERDLAALHGDAYRAYQRRVPMLLPLRRPARAGQSSDTSINVP